MTSYAVIAGGGTSGHVLPAIAIAEGLIDAGHDQSTIAYYGARQGVEVELIPPTGLRHEFFDVVGLKRELSMKALVNNAAFAPKLLRARRRAVNIMRSDPPAVVVSVGGYASLPAVLAAKTLDIPVVVVSYDRRPGRSSSWAARSAAASAVAFSDSKLPRAVWTGAPVRRSIRTLDRSTLRTRARQQWGIGETQFFIGVIGGSLGSGALNDAVRRLVRAVGDDSTVSIRHVVGPRFYDEQIGTDPASSRSKVDYRVVPYEDDMVTMYGAIDLLIARGGAGTVAEVAATGVPAVLVPWDGAADDHQRENVRWLSDAGGAILLEEKKVGEDLARVVAELRHDEEARLEMGRTAWRLGERNRSGAIAELVDSVVRGEARG